MIRAGLLAVAVALSASAQAPAPAPPSSGIELAALFPPAPPEGFTLLPDQPGRLGPLDAPAAAAVLDRSGRMTTARLDEAGFRKGYAKAWSKPDTQEVVLSVLLEFADAQAAFGFMDDVVESRGNLERFETGVAGAVGFVRGPATPTAAEPGQLEAVLRRGPVVAIVVVAGHLAFPAREPAAALVRSQSDALAPVPVGTTEPEADREERPVLLLVVAAALLAVVGRRAASEVTRR